MSNLRKFRTQCVPEAVGCKGGSRYDEGCRGFPYSKKFIGFGNSSKTNEQNVRTLLAGALAGKKNLLRNRENRAEWTRRLIGHRHGKAHGLIGPAKERGDGLIRKRIGLSNLLSLGRFRRCSDLKPSSLPRVGRLIPLGPRWGDRH